MQTSDGEQKVSEIFVSLNLETTINYIPLEKFKFPVGEIIKQSRFNVSPEML